MNLQFMVGVEDDAADAALWYDDRCLGLGDEFFAELRAAYGRIASMPESFAMLDDSPDQVVVRACQLHRFPYYVAFVVFSDEILVVSVTHAHRRQFHWRNRLT